MSVHNGLIDDSTEMLITDVRQQTMEDPSHTGPLVLHTSAATPVAVRCMSQRTEGAETPGLGVGGIRCRKWTSAKMYMSM